MKQTSVFRVTAEICFLFAVLNAFSVFEPWRVPMALFTVACLLLGLVNCLVQLFYNFICICVAC